MKSRSVTHTLNSTNSASPANEEYGVIISLKNSFGFVQSISTEEQLYLSERELRGECKIGDRIGYVRKIGQKGPFAESVRVLGHSSEKLATVQGRISRLPERHRSALGCIEIDRTKLEGTLAAELNAKPNCLAFFKAVDVQSQKSKLPFVENGDVIDFTINRLIGSHLFFATDIKLQLSRKDKAVHEQIQKMLDAGAVREKGIVSTVKNKEYGFVQAEERKDELYFKIDDVQDDKKGNIKEGTELEFFVVAEIIRGKSCNRAIHVKVVPNGTVKLEFIIANNVTVCVVSEPHANDDYPGSARLDSTIDVPATATLSAQSVAEVDLWRRCMPDDLVVRPGDKLTVNVHYYRPENLFFARSVRVHSFMTLGREIGVIRGLKDHFGFIGPMYRKTDLYFKNNSVVGFDGSIVNSSELSLNMKVSFDLSVDEGKMMRAVRVQLVREEDLARQDEDRFLLKRGVIGVVIRSASKKDAVGLIKIDPTEWMEIQEMKYCDSKVSNDLEQFLAMDWLPSYFLYDLPISVRRMYEQVIAMKYAQRITIEESTTYTQDSQVKVLKLVKTNSTATATDITTDTNNDNERKPNPSKNGFTIPYNKDDYLSMELGPLSNDMEVIFNIHHDQVTNKKIAKSIRITDEPVEEVKGRLRGIIEVLVEKGDKFGFIRCVPSNEKLFWHVSSTSNPSSINVGSRVEFDLRRRGGFRCATGIIVTNPPSSVEPVFGRATSLLVAPNKAVIVNVVNLFDLKNMFLDVLKVAEAIKLEKSKKSVGKTWEKKVLSPTGNNAAADNEKAADVDDVELNLEGEDGAELDASGLGKFTRVSYNPKFFNVYQRSQVSVNLAGVQVGDVFPCACSVDWNLPGLINQVSNAEAVVSKAVKKTGRIQRLKFRVKLPEDAPAALVSYCNQSGLTSVDLAEIGDVAGSTDAEGKSTDENSFYCLSSEISLVNDNSRDVIQSGDEVEFWVIPEYPLYAFGVILVPKSKDLGINFQGRRPEVNAELKEIKSKVGANNLITMAKGPPTDTSLGFESGWREVDKDAIKALPWASLLGHLTA